MKKLFIVLATGLVLVACNDTPTQTGTGGSIDSNYVAPGQPSDNTNVHPDSVRIDTTGASTNSNNSGSAKDDTGRSK
jgi:hypothetical protein